MNAKTRETCWFCDTNIADPSAFVVQKMYRWKIDNWERIEVSIPRCLNCKRVHNEIDSMELDSLQPESKEGKHIQIMKGVSVPLSSFVLGVLLAGVVVGGFLLLGFTSDPVLSCAAPVGILITGAVLWGIIGGIKGGSKLVKARNQLLSERGIKVESTLSHPDVMNLTEKGWKIGEPPMPKKPPVTEEPKDVWPVATSSPHRKPSKRSDDGYLLPPYWRCIVCKASEKDIIADFAVRVGVFAMAIEDDSCFQELGQIDRQAARIYSQYIADPLGGVKVRPPGTEQFEDTAGLARDRNGWGFDAVFLCRTHAGEMEKAIKNMKKRIEVPPRSCGFDSAPLLLEEAPDLEQLFFNPPVIQKPTEENREFWASAERGPQWRRMTLVGGYLQHPKPEVRLATLGLMEKHQLSSAMGLNQLLFDLLAADPDEAVRREVARITWLSEKHVNCEYAVNKAKDEILAGSEDHPVGPTRARKALALLVEAAPDEDARRALEHLISLPWP